MGAGGGGSRVPWGVGDITPGTQSSFEKRDFFYCQFQGDGGADSCWYVEGLSCSFFSDIDGNFS